MKKTAQDISELYRQCEDAVEKTARAFALRHGTRSGMTQDDYLQASRIAVWQKLPDFDPAKSSLGAWAARVAHNAIRDEVRACDEVGRSRRADGIRGATRSLEVTHGQGAGQDAGRSALLRDLLAAPRAMDRRIAYESIGELLAGLDERQRVVMYLKEIAELSDAEAGEVLDLPERFIAEIHVEALALLRGQQHSPASRIPKPESRRNAKITFSSASGQFGPLFGGGTN